eukprot:364320-Chlamydomonas_euryale.AAC.4
MQALISKWGAWDVDEAPPIEVDVSVVAADVGGGGGERLRIRVADTGSGVSAEQLERTRCYFYTTVEKTEPTGWFMFKWFTFDFTDKLGAWGTGGGGGKKGEAHREEGQARA